MKPKSTIFTILKQDCVKAMRALPSKSVDVVVTSPPYNIGIKYSNYRDRMEREEYLLWSLAWTREVFGLLKPNGSFFLNLGACPTDPFLPFDLIVALRNRFVLQNTFHWIKSITVETRKGDLISAGHFKPVNSKRYVNDCHEYIFHLTKGGVTQLDRHAVGVPYADKTNISRWGHTGGRDLRCRGNNWFLSYKTISNRAKQRPHPATFPEDLAANCIKIHGVKPGMVVMDPFLGSGSSAIAARTCGVTYFLGFDLSGIDVLLRLEHRTHNRRSPHTAAILESQSVKSAGLASGWAVTPGNGSILPRDQTSANPASWSRGLTVRPLPARTTCGHA